MQIYLFNLTQIHFKYTAINTMLKKINIKFKKAKVISYQINEDVYIEKRY